MQYVRLPDIGYRDRIESIVRQGETVDLSTYLAEAHEAES